MVHEATMGDDYDYPPDDSDRTWHMHDDGTWGWGIKCDICKVEQRGDAYAHTLPKFNLHHLKRQNALGITKQSEIKEALGDRWNDPTVERRK